MKSLCIVFVAGLSFFISKAQQFINYTNTNIVYGIAVNAQNDKWFATYGGAVKYDGNNWTTYTTADGLINNSVNTVCADYSGNLSFA